MALNEVCMKIGLWLVVSNHKGEAMDHKRSTDKAPVASRWPKVSLWPGLGGLNRRGCCTGTLEVS